jgi:hypothetical protein
VFVADDAVVVIFCHASAPKAGSIDVIDSLTQDPGHDCPDMTGLSARTSRRPYAFADT